MLKIFGIVFARQKEIDAENENNTENWKEETRRVRVENVMLREKVASLSKLVSGQRREHLAIDPFIGDPEPKDTKVRTSYVSTVAGVYKDILAPKWKQMIANALFLLEDPSNSKEHDLMLKGAVYALRENLLWGEKMVNEHVALLSGGGESK